MKNPNNEQMIKSLLKDLSPIEVAILRERIVKVFEMTEQAIAENPESFSNRIVHHSLYTLIANKVTKHIGFNK
jgi:hypothetical protein